jgi:hypothetical protein
MTGTGNAASTSLPKLNEFELKRIYPVNFVGMTSTALQIFGFSRETGWRNTRTTQIYTIAVGYHGNSKIIERGSISSFRTRKNITARVMSLAIARKEAT